MLLKWVHIISILSTCANQFKRQFIISGGSFLTFVCWKLYFCLKRTKINEKTGRGTFLKKTKDIVQSTNRQFIFWSNYNLTLNIARCVSRNVGGEMSSTIHLSIKRRFEASVAPDVQTVNVAQKAVFVCDVKSPHADKGNGRLANLVAQGRALK